VTVAYIDAHREAFGVEPICEVLQVAASTYYAARSRPLSARAVRDAAVKVTLLALWTANYEVYGVRKLCEALVRAGERVGRASAGARPYRPVTTLGVPCSLPLAQGDAACPRPSP